MKIFPAIDIKDKKCVRLVKGNFDNKVISSTTDYSTKVVCSVEKENIFGTQFHPEKSDKTGLKIINNFINL